MTADKIPLIEKDITIMSETIKDLKKDMEQHRNDTAVRHKEFQEFREELFEKLETRFAWKWTEKVLIFIWTSIWIALIWAIMALILKK